MQGGTMKNYEIRVISGHRPGPDIYSGSYLNDHAAVRRAMTLVKPSQWIEVWCGARCLYAGSPGPIAQPSAVPVWKHMESQRPPSPQAN
jgi:hypothetical protein